MNVWHKKRKKVQAKKPSFVAMIMLTPHHLPSTRTDIIREAPIRVSKNFVKANVELTAND